MTSKKAKKVIKEMLKVYMDKIDKALTVSLDVDCGIEEVPNINTGYKESAPNGEVTIRLVMYDPEKDGRKELYETCGRRD